MKIATKPPEPVMILSLQSSGDGVALYAEIGEDSQRVMFFEADEKGLMVASTLKLRDDFPIRKDAHGHLDPRMKA